MENLTTLELGGKIGLISIEREPGNSLMRKFTHSQQELVLRNRDPEPMFLKGASIPEAMIGHEDKFRKLNAYAHRMKPDLIKYGKREHFENFSFKVSLASSFLDPSLNTSQMDDEMKAIYYPHPDEVIIKTQDGRKLDGITKVEVIHEAQVVIYK